MNGTLGRNPLAQMLLDGRYLMLMSWMSPSNSAPANARARLPRRATTTAASDATMSRVNAVASSPTSGVSMTPDSPANPQPRAHDAAPTTRGSVPARPLSDGESTTARISSPAVVNRSMSARAMPMMIVPMNTSSWSLFSATPAMWYTDTWLPASPGRWKIGLSLKTRKVSGVRATYSPTVATSMTTVLARARLRARTSQRNRPMAGPTTPMDTTSATRSGQCQMPYMR